jgi:hypothetical protein
MDMRKEDVSELAQLLTGMRESLGKLAEAYSEKDAEKLASIKKEILNLQKEIDKLL